MIQRYTLQLTSIVKMMKISTIHLDPNKTPSENVQSYYKKYNKLKKSEESAKEQLKKITKNYNI